MLSNEEGTALLAPAGATSIVARGEKLFLCDRLGGQLTVYELLDEVGSVRSKIAVPQFLPLR